MNIGAGSYNGLSWGSGTKYQITQVVGIEDMPPVVSSDQQRGFAHGSYRGLDWLDERVVELDFLIKGVDNPDYVALMAAFNLAFSDQQSADLPFLYADSTRLLNATCRGRKHNYDARWLATWGTAHVRLEASDPRLYENILNTSAIGVPAVSGGLTWPLVWPLSWGSATSGAANILNSGSVAVAPVVTFTGPITNPSIIKNIPTPAQTMAFAIDLAVGDTLVVDFDARTAVLNGTGNRVNTIVPGSSWWELAANTTTQVSLSASAGSGTASVAWRNAYQ